MGKEELLKEIQKDWQSGRFLRLFYVAGIVLIQLTLTGIILIANNDTKIVLGSNLSLLALFMWYVYHKESL